MTQSCPHCGGALPPTLAAKGGGNPALPPELRRAGADAGEAPVRLGSDLVGWRGMVWATANARKATECWSTGEPIAVSQRVYRPITNGKDRYRRVLAATWSHLAS